MTTLEIIDELRGIRVALMALNVRMIEKEIESRDPLGVEHDGYTAIKMYRNVVSKLVEDKDWKEIG